MAGEWIAQLPDDLKANETFTSYATLGDFAKAHVDTVGRVQELDGKVKDYEGKTTDLSKRLENALFVPGEDATDADRAAFYAKLGRPETADKYTITKPADLPEGVPYNPEIEKSFRDFAHAQNLTDKQASQLYGWYYGLVRSGYEAQAKTEKEATEKAVNALKDEWKGDQYQANLTLAQRVFKTFGGDTPEIKEFIENTKVNGLALGDHPLFLRIFAGIGKVISEDSLSQGGRGGTGGELSDEDKAKARFPNTKF